MDLSTQNFSFPKEEKLTHKKVIGLLFEEGKYVKRYPFKILFLPNKEAKHQVAIGVPKRKIKLAVERNKIKRRIREAYRLNKHLLHTEQSLTPLAMIILFHGNYVPSYSEVETNLVQLLQQILEKEKGKNTTI